MHRVWQQAAPSSSATYRVPSPKEPSNQLACTHVQSCSADLQACSTLPLDAEPSCLMTPCGRLHQLSSHNVPQRLVYPCYQGNLPLLFHRWTPMRRLSPQVYGLFYRSLASYTDHIPSCLMGKPRAFVIIKATNRDYVYVPAQGGFQVRLQIYRIEKVVLRHMFDEDVHVAIWALFLASTRTKDPKLLGLVPPRDGVYLISLRAYLVQHAHIFLPSPNIGI